IGQLSEAIGRKKTFIIVGVFGLIGFPLLYHGLAGASTAGAVTVYVLLLTFIGNAAYAPVLVFLNERYPTVIRSSGTGLSWNMGFAIGGMMPTFVTLASGVESNIPTAISWFLGIIFAVYLIGALVVKETKGNFN
ncbi:MAG TPA: MHS family MFS transporter, partial [Alicyclobacillus sp.]|nr:MHS family MFS transporter [Alicyclobacillus sp.]